MFKSAIQANKIRTIAQLRGLTNHAERADEVGRARVREGANLRELQDDFQTKRVIDSWIVFYNAVRPHTALEKRTPEDAYFAAIQMNQAA